MLCSICLDVPQNPFVTPCGHVFCLECLITSSQKSPDAMKAPCPTCRATFSLVSPDPAFVPEKYRSFIDSNIRRVYLDDSHEIALQEKVAQLESRVKSLEKDKSLLMARCESYMAAATSHAQRERDARMRCITLQQELKQANFWVAQLVEKEAQKTAISTPAAVTHTSCSSSPLDGDPPTPDGPMLMLGKRGSNTDNERGSQMNSLLDIFRPTAPLPKRRRVSRMGPAQGE